MLRICLFVLCITYSLAQNYEFEANNGDERRRGGSRVEYTYESNERSGGEEAGGNGINPLGSIVNIGSNLNSGIVKHVMVGKKVMDFFPNTFDSLTGTNLGRLAPMGSNCPAANAYLAATKGVEQSLESSNGGAQNVEVGGNRNQDEYGNVLYQTSMTSDGSSGGDAGGGLGGGAGVGAGAGGGGGGGLGGALGGGLASVLGGLGGLGAGIGIGPIGVGLG